MPDNLKVEISEKEIQALIKKLNSFGQSAEELVKNGLDDGAQMVINHARADHYFVGTGKGANNKAKEHELTFQNPDGSLRFKVRTENLLNSIQAVAAKVMMGSVTAEIRVGMKYARKVEEGGPGRRPFPFLRPSVEANRAKIFERIRTMLRAAIKKHEGKVSG